MSLVDLGRPTRHGATCNLAGALKLVSPTRRPSLFKQFSTLSHASSSASDEPASSSNSSGPAAPRGASWFRLRGSALTCYTAESGDVLWRGSVMKVAKVNGARVALRIAFSRGEPEGTRWGGTRTVCLDCSGSAADWVPSFREAAAGAFDLHYRKLGALGKGHFSNVLLCVDRVNGEKFAVKVIKKDGQDVEKMRKFIRREVKVLSVTRHENLVRAVDFFSHKGRPHIVMEYVSGGSLRDAIDIIGSGGLGEAEAKRIFRGVLRGVSYLHAMRIVHRDIKPENILLGKRGTGCIKITDFGLSTFLGESDKIFSVVGTPSYVSPELCAGVPYGAATDLWSCGVMLYYMLSGRRAFGGETRSEVKKNILRGVVEFPEKSFRRVGQNARRLVGRLLDMDQTTRITAEQALTHPWMAYTADGG